MEVLFFEPAYKDYLWGGNRLKEEFGKNTPYEITAESWEISANKNGKSTVKNGEYKGLDLQELFEKQDVKAELFGKKALNLKEFPILIKFIDANKNLSVQVHPDDEYAKKYENSSGKTEMWYIMDCNKNAQIICGLKPETTKEQLNDCVRNGKIKEILKYIDVEKGDTTVINPGTIHAIMEGTLICEIQQNCDLTYRVYDWDRVDKNGNPRELHIDKALDVINLENNTDKIKSKNVEMQNLIECKYFKVDKLEIKGAYSEKSNSDTFFAMCVVDGNGKIIFQNKEHNITKGDSFIIPANLGEYNISGDLTILKTYL